MRFSEHWLRTMANPPIGSPELCERLTMAGLEVEEAVPAAPAFDNVVVGRIESLAPHPNADRLAMLRYGVDDLRRFYENDLRFLAQFK